MTNDGSNDKRLFLLDAYALIFRGYYALIKNPRINSAGMDTSAIMGFVNSLFDVIRRENPEYLAVAFDKGGSADRVELYPEYKANRDATPDAIKIAVPYIQRILKAMHIPIVVEEGIEADDLIGTLAKQAEKEGFTVYMVTPDKDYAQLVSENIFMYKPARMGNGIEIWGIPEVLAKFEIERPEQVIDYLGMMGDSSDNIPGLPGVGEKTAKKYLAEFGSMESLIENAHTIKGKLGEKIVANAALGILSKQLATIRLDCPVTFNAQDYTLDNPDVPAVHEIFDELEFRRAKEMLAKIFAKEDVTTSRSGSNSSSSSSSAGAGQFSLFDAPGSGTVAEAAATGRKTLATTDHLYQLVQEGMGTKLFLQTLMAQSSVCFDTETTGLDPLRATLVGIAFSWEQGKGFYLPVPEDQDAAQLIVDALKPFFESATIEKIGQNLKYDIKVLYKYSVIVKAPMFDTMLAHYLINPDMRHNMDVLAETYLNYTPQSITELIGKKGKNQSSMRDVAVEKVKEYAVEDADITLQLKQHFKPELAAAGTDTLFNDIEMPLLEVLAAMESEGINLDEDFLKSLSGDLDNDIIRLEKDIYKAAGETFNIGSPKQLGIILFEKLKLVDKPKKTKTGQYSTAEDVLSYLAKDNPIIQQILDYRGLSKLKSTYVDALPNQVSPITNRIHTNYMQTVAATGRLSSTDPNLQNIPIRTERGRQVRKAFIPRDKNHTLLAADYSQIELRIIAALSEEENMIAAFTNGEDIHTSTAAKVFNIALEDVTREQRSNAKTVNFGIIYGVSAFGLSNQTDLDRNQAKELIETYYTTYPKLRAYMQSQVDFARENGYVETVLGRRRYLNDINSPNAVVRGAAERNAVNAPIQGSAADIIKIAMINIYNRFREGGYKSRMLLQVHDELVFDIHNDELEELKVVIKEEMENAYKMIVPLDVEVGTGQNWLEAH